MEIIYREESYLTMGAYFEVYKEMGSGFAEPVYQECLELAHQGLPFKPQQLLVLSYKGKRLNGEYKPDFILFEKIILEKRRSQNSLMPIVRRFTTT